MQPARDLAQLLRGPVSSSRERLVQQVAPWPRAARLERARARRSLSTTETRRCWAPSCRLRSSRRRCSSPALTRRARDAIRSARAWALATASDDELAERAEAVLGLRRQRVLARDRDRAPQRAGDDDRGGGGRAVAGAEDRLGDLAASSPPQSSIRAGRAGRQHAREGRVLLGRQALADAEHVDVVAVVAADDRRACRRPRSARRRGVDLQHARALLGHRREHPLGADLRGDERGHAPQRALLGREPADLGELGLGSPSSARSSSSRAGARSVRSMPVVTSETGVAAGAGHRLVRPRDQAPAAVLGLPVADLRARRARLPDVREELAERLALLRRDHEVARVATEHLLAARTPVARSHASLNSRIRPSRSSTQTSDCVVSVRILANDSPTGNSSGCGGSSMSVC